MAWERLSVAKHDFERVASETGLVPDQVQSMWTALAAASPPPPPPPSTPSAPPVHRFDGPHIAFYLGGTLALAAMSWLMAEGWDAAGPWAGLAMGLGYAVAFGLGGRALLRRGWTVPGGLLATVVIGLVPLIVFAFQQATGVWGEPEFGEYHDFYEWVGGVWFPMEVAALVVGVWVLRWTNFPFAVAPIAFFTWFMSMDAAEVLFGNDASGGKRAAVSVVVGLALMVAGLRFDHRRKPSHAFWCHLFGLAAASGGTCVIVTDHGEVGWTVIGFAGLGLIVVAAVLRRRTYAVFGAVALSSWIGHLAFEVFGGSPLFPLALAAIGVGIVFFGIALSRHGQRWSAAFREALPGAVVRLVPPPPET